MTEPRPNAHRPRVFFVHLQKAAGTSLIFKLRRVFDRSALYPDASDGAPENRDSVISVPHLLERWPHRRHQVSILTGHFPLCTAELLDDEFETMTTLREPVERTLSYLRHHRALTPEDAERSLEELYDDQERFDTFIHNHMVKMLSLTTDEMTDGALTKVAFGPERLARAKANLERIDLVGLQERYPELWHAAAERFGWDLGKVVHANRTEPEDASTAFRARIAADNADDVALYRHAQELVEERFGPAQG